VKRRRQDGDVKSPLQRLREEGFLAQKTRDGAAVLTAQADS
jgi:hypothetical protein